MMKREIGLENVFQNWRFMGSKKPPPLKEWWVRRSRGGSRKGQGCSGGQAFAVLSPRFLGTRGAGVMCLKSLLQDVNLFKV